MSHKTLPISDRLSLPIDAATQTFAFIARKGAGKTYAAGRLVELLNEHDVQTVILDTVGNWYGLRLAKDGKHPGLDIPVIGGLRGDIPLQATGGELIADIVVDTGRSLILDISQFSLTDRKKFATQFGHRLWQRKKGQGHPSPVMLVIEESQLIVPQHVDSGSAAMVGIYEEIIRLGRNYGIGCTMISQRPQSINKDVLNQTECLFVGQVNGSQERDALRKWISYQGMDQKLTDELPSLKVGEMWVWSPQWLQVLRKIKISPKRTYDASATPKVGEKRVARELKPLDLDDLKQKMSATIEKAKQDDPRELRKQIAELQRATKIKSPAVQPKLDHAAIDRIARQAVMPFIRALEDAMQIIAKIEVLGLPDNSALSADDTKKIIEAAVEKVTRLAEEKLTLRNRELAALRKRAEKLKEDVKALKSDRKIDLHVVAQHVPAQPAKVLTMEKRPTSHDVKAVQPVDGLTGPEQRILNAIAWMNSIGVAEPNQTAVAFLAGYTTGGGAWNNPKGHLRSMGLIEYLPGNRMKMTDAGTKLAQHSDIPLDASELQRHVLERLPGPERKILSVLIDNRDGMANEALAAASGYSAGGGAFNNPKGRLRSLGLIDYKNGLVVPEPLLWLEG